MKRKIWMRHAKRGWDILRHQGPHAFLNKVRIKIAEKRIPNVVSQGEKVISYEELDLLSKDTLTTLADEQNRPILAVHLHLYYEDLLPEFVESLHTLPCTFDLYISLRDWGEETASHIDSVEKQCSHISMARSIFVRSAVSRGRDIAPMYVLFGQELCCYRYVLHMHSKKSLYLGSEQKGWRNYSVQTLLGSREQAARMVSLLEKDDTIGIIYPERFSDMKPEAYGWLSNADRGREFLESIGIPFRDEIFLYPAGSFFIVRNAAIPQLWKRQLSNEDFDEEAGQTDGTLAHVLERAIGEVVSANGFHHAIVANDRREIFIDWDVHTFMPVFLRGDKKLLMDLSAYDVVSFDIFDTLLTRVWYRPTDLFAYVERRLTSGEWDSLLSGRRDWAGYGQVRIDAEADAIKSHGAETTIYHIYEELQRVLGLSCEDRDALMQLEIATEISGLLPRRDMLALYERLLSDGKTVILVSDTYLSAEILKSILTAKGIDESKDVEHGYVHLYLSCDYGMRKDDGSLWGKVLSDFDGHTFAHVGDNLQSDWQMLSDRGEKTVWVMNPRQEEQVSGEVLLCPSPAIKDEVIYSLCHGLLVNGGLFNSPFALYPNGIAGFKDTYGLGFTVFGPLMYEYMRWLQAIIPGDAKIAFLAREGYIFQKAYGLACSQKKENLYLLASRRAVSVAGIRSEDDIREICRRDYDGDIRNLLRSRLGVPEEMIVRLPKKYVHFKEGMPDDDYEYAMEVIAPLFEEILSYAKEERREYLKYFYDVIAEDDVDRIVFVDIGYTGTIQYYLSKLLERPVTGAYMAVFQPHPQLSRRGCRVLSMYGPYKKDSESGTFDFLRVLEKTQLFLESVLQAPYGQLLRFLEGKPIYKEEASPSEEIRLLQQGLLDYVSLRGNIDVSDTEDEGRAYMEFLYEKLLCGRYINEDMAKIFVVEDTYSQDAVLHYDAKSDGWKI